LEIRLSLFEEGRDCFFDLGRRQALGEQAALKLHPLKDFVLATAPEQALSLAERLGRLGEQARDDFVESGLKLACLRAVADESDHFRFVGTKRLREQKVASRAAPSGEA